MPRRALPAAGLVAALALVLVGCGGGPSPPSATLILDFTPNAVHAGIYSALARGYDRAASVRLSVRAPSASTDSIKLLADGRVDFAVLDIHDLGLARQRGLPLVGVMALVQRPLAAVIAAPGIHGPRALQGRTVGVTGAPSDEAVLHSVISGAGGDPRLVHEVTIGFNAVPALLGGRVGGATAFWDVEGVALRRKRPGFHEFRVDDYGAPSYPELVLCATHATVRDRPRLVRRVLRALTRGYGVTLRHPRASAADLEAADPALDPGLVSAELRALHPAFVARDGRFGELAPARLRAWAHWDVRFGILRRTPDIGRAFDAGLLPAR